MAAILGLIAWFAFPPPATYPSSLEQPIPKCAFDSCSNLVRSQGLFMARTPETLLSIKSALRTHLASKEAKDWGLNPSQEHQIMAMLPAWGMIPTDAESAALEMMTCNNSRMWSAYNYMRHGSRSLLDRLLGRNLPK